MVSTLQKLNLKIYLHIIKHDIIPQYNKYPVAQYPISMSNLERKKASKEENDNCAHHHHNLPEIWKVVGKKCKSCDVHKESIKRKTKCPSTSFPGSQPQPHVPLVDRLSRVRCCFLGIKHYKSDIIHSFSREWGIDFTTVNTTKPFGMYFPIHLFTQDKIGNTVSLMVIVLAKMMLTVATVKWRCWCWWCLKRWRWHIWWSSTERDCTAK